MHLTTQSGMRVGGAVSLGELVDLLGGADGRGADAQSNIAAHVSRIAGAPGPSKQGGFGTVTTLVGVGKHEQLCLGMAFMRF